MIKYYKKEDNFCKYYVKVNEEANYAFAVYKNKEGVRAGINIFTCYPSLYSSTTSDYVISTEEEFIAKLNIINSLLNTR